MLRGVCLSVRMGDEHNSQGTAYKILLCNLILIISV